MKYANLDISNERLAKARDAREKYRESYYDKAREVIGDEGVLALREYMTLYDEKNYLWAASLWDPEIGGFYYSASARQTEGYLPDIESTVQMMRYLYTSGLMTGLGSSYGEGTPDFMREKLIRFATSLFDPEDGYVYHPQWGQNITVTRRGRDLNWAVGMLREQFKVSPPCETALDRLAKQGEKKEEEKKSLPAHLTSPDNFRNYLLQFENEDSVYYVRRASYKLGNYINAQVYQIKAAGKEYVDILTDWFGKHQRSDNGAWTAGVTDDSVNGLMKIALTYSICGRAVPNIENALKTAIEYAKKDVLLTWVCAPYNTYHTLNTLLENASVFGNKELCTNLRQIIASNAPTLIRNMRRKVEVFKKDDGAFSYYPKTSISGSQSAPVAPEQLPEGDVNANSIASTGTLTNMCMVLGIKPIPIFCREDGDIFFELIKSAKPIVKTEPIPENLARRSKERQY